MAALNCSGNRLADRRILDSSQDTILHNITKNPTIPNLISVPSKKFGN